MVWVAFISHGGNISGRLLTLPLSLCLQSGQVYFINDGVSVNVFEWLTPLVS